MVTEVLPDLIKCPVFQELSVSEHWPKFSAISFLPSDLISKNVVAPNLINSQEPSGALLEAIVCDK